MLKKFIISLVALLAFLVANADVKNADLVSPNGKIKVEVSTTDKGVAQFSVSYKSDGKNILALSNSDLGLKTNQRNFAENLKLISASKNTSIVDKYKMISGKRSDCKNSASQKIFRFENAQKEIINIAIRAYNDGVAIKYLLDAKDGEKIIEETTTYSVEDGKKRWSMMYDPLSYENFFEPATDGRANPRGQSWGYPMLVETTKDVFVFFTEANIKKDNCASFLNNNFDKAKYKVCLPEHLAIKGKWESPWRVLIVGSLANLVESTLVTDVSEPCKLKDVSWIKPASASWVYWSHNHSSDDFQVVKQFIDLASDMKWPYCLIDWKWDKMKNGGNIDDAIKYASEKNVKLMLWYNSGTALLDPNSGPIYRLNEQYKRQNEYKWLKEKGIVGIKIDFFKGDTSEMMNYYIDLLEDAAKFNMMINFHGATIPRGWQRTYPNLMTVEGVYGAEWYNNLPVLTNRAAAHNATLPFTRNIVGPMDYTPCTFSNSQHPHITSYAHELALLVLFESALQHMPDRPSAYQALPNKVKEFLRELPTTWDDIKLLSGYPEKEVVIARCKGSKWYIGGINGTNEAQTLNFSTKSIKNLGKKITIFKDNADGKGFVIEENQKRTTNDFSIPTNPRGGFVMVIE